MGSEPVGSHDFLNLRYSAISLEKKSQKALPCSWPGPYAAPTHIATLRVNGIGNVKSGQKKPFVARTIHPRTKNIFFNVTPTSEIYTLSLLVALPAGPADQERAR